MKSTLARILGLNIVFALFISHSLSAQIFIEEWPNGQTRHEGPMTGGLRTGHHLYYYSNGKKQADINFSAAGAPLHIKTWDEKGNLQEDTPFEPMPKINLPAQDYAREDNGLEHSIPDGGRIVHDYDNRKVTVHYAGYLEDGSEFDNSFDRGKPFSFKAGIGEVIPGFDHAVALLAEGQTGWFRIPSSLGYQDHLVGNIPPGSTLVYKIELLKVKAK